MTSTISIISQEYMRQFLDRLKGVMTNQLRENTSDPYKYVNNNYYLQEMH